MKSVIFFLLALVFAFTTTATLAAPVETGNPPKHGFNYQKAQNKAARYNFFNRPHNKNGGCGWAKATRR